MLTVIAFAFANGMSLARDDWDGNKACSGACNFDGSQSSQLRILVAMSVTSSEIHPHLLGHALPPKVRRRAISRSQTPSTPTCVKDLTAIFWFKCWRQ